MEHAVDVILGASAALLFARIVWALLVPPRRMDGLSWALAALFAVFAVAFALGPLQAAGWIPAVLPTWARWTIRIAYILAAIGVNIELWRLRQKQKGKT